MTPFGGLQPNITLKTVLDLLKTKAVCTFLKKMIHFRGRFYHRSVFTYLILPDEMEVSSKYLPLIDPLTPFVSSDNEAWSDEVRLRHVTFECQSQGRTPPQSLHQGP